MKDKERYKSHKPKEKSVKCAKCGYKLNEYVPGIGSGCRCENCGYKDPCCE